MEVVLTAEGKRFGGREVRQRGGEQEGAKIMQPVEKLISAL